MGTTGSKEGNTPRQLGFNFNVEKTFDIKTISFLGQTLFIKYRVAVKDGKAINQIIIDSSLGQATFGNDGVNVEINKSWSFRKKFSNLFSHQCLYFL